MTNNPVIGLYGIGGVYNYGCEAIVRGTELLIRRIWPNAIIRYASAHPEDDGKRLRGSNIEIIARDLPNRLSIKRAYLKMLRTVGIPWLPFPENLDWIDQCDIIFSIGGDIYTIPNYHAPRWITGYYHPLVHFGEIVKQKGKKLVVWGASIGPFDANPLAKTYFLSHLSQADLISAREPETIRYLASNHLTENVVRTADPAFFMPVVPPRNRSATSRLRIGINLSPLSSRQAFGQSTQSLVNTQSILVSELVQSFNAEVLLIPHVFCEKPHDDDHLYLKRIYDALPMKSADRVILAGEDYGFLHMHSIIETCDIVLASRMHCAINSIIGAIPTIFLGYSNKSKGMCEYVYLSSDYVLTLSEITKGVIIRKIQDILDQQQHISSFLTLRMKEIRNDAHLVLKRLLGLTD